MACIQTLVGHRCEIWSVATTPQVADAATLVITGSADEFIRGYQLHPSLARSTAVQGGADGGSANQTKDASVDVSSAGAGAAGGVGGESEVLVYYGAVARSGNVLGSSVKAGLDKCCFVNFSPGGEFVAAQAGSKAAEFFRLRSLEELRKIMKRKEKKIKRKKRKVAEQGVSDDVDGEGEDAANASAIFTKIAKNEPRLEDRLEFVHHSRFAAKAKSVVFSPRVRSAPSDGKLIYQILVTLSNNTLEVLQLKHCSEKAGEDGAAEDASATVVVSKASVVDWHGHRSDIRSLALSSDGLTLASCSSEGIKVCPVTQLSRFALPLRHRVFVLWHLRRCGLAQPASIARAVAAGIRAPPRSLSMDTLFASPLRRGVAAALAHVLPLSVISSRK